MGTNDNVEKKQECAQSPILANHSKLVQFKKWPHFNRPGATGALCVLLLCNLVCRRDGLGLPWAKEVGGQHQHGVVAPIVFAQVRQAQRVSQGSGHRDRHCVADLHVPASIRIQDQQMFSYSLDLWKYD